MTRASTDSRAGMISPLSLRALAVYAPLLLFASGILRWVDQFDGLPEVGLPWAFAQALLVAALLCFACLSTVVVAEVRRLSAASWILPEGHGHDRAHPRAAAPGRAPHPHRPRPALRRA